MQCFHPTPRRLPSPRLTLVIVASACMCLFSGWALAAPQSPASPAFFTSVLGSTAQGVSVVTTIAWDENIFPDEPVLLSLTDRDGEVVVDEWIWPLPGEVTDEVLLDALLEATSRAQHHEIHLADGNGNALAESYPLQVRLACESQTMCEFEIRGGISAPHMILLDSEMVVALEEAEAAGASDLLDQVAQNHPDMWGDVYSMGWQLRILEGLSGVGDPESQIDCACHWMLQVDDFNLDVGADLDHSESNTCGGSHSVDYRRKGGNTPSTLAGVGGTSSMTADIGCWKASGEESASVEIQPGLFIDVPGVMVAHCGIECGGSVTYTGLYDVDMTTITKTEGDSVSIFDAVTFSVDTQQVFLDFFGLDSYGGVDLMDNKARSGSWVGAPGSTAEMLSGTLIRLNYSAETEVTIPSQGNNQGSGLNLQCWDSTASQEPCAEGKNRGIYEIQVSAQSGCTSGPLNNDAFSTFRVTPTSNGGGDDINLLVGKCDG